MRLVPGMGTIHGCWESSQASASWAGVAPVSAAILLRTSTSARLALSASWTGPIDVSDSGHQFDQDATPRVGPDGTVYVSYINGPNEKSTKNNAALIAKSTDGGNTWSRSYVAAPIPAPAQSLPNALYRGGTDVTSTVDQRTGKVVVVYNDTSSGALNVWATHTATATPGSPTDRNAARTWPRSTTATYASSASPANTARPNACVAVSSVSWRCITRAVDHATAASAT